KQTVLERFATAVDALVKNVRRPSFQPRNEMRQLLPVFVHARYPPRHLRSTGFETDDFQVRECFQHAATNINHPTNHGLAGAPHHVREKEILRKPIMTHGTRSGVVEDY